MIGRESSWDRTKRVKPRNESEGTRMSLKSAIDVNGTPALPRTLKKDANYVFYELTRSICPQCRKVIDAKILLRDNNVYMAKRCPDCGPFEALVYGDAQAYRSEEHTSELQSLRHLVC